MRTLCVCVHCVRAWMRRRQMRGEGSAAFVLVPEAETSAGAARADWRAGVGRTERALERGQGPVEIK